MYNRHSLSSQKPQVCLPNQNEMFISFSTILSSSSSSSSTLPTNNLLSDVDPAFKVKLVECIINGYTEKVALRMVKQYGHSELTMQSCDINLAFIRYAYDIFTLNDLWSMRRVALSLANKISSIYVKNNGSCDVSGTINGDDNDASERIIVEIVLMIIRRGVEDNKSFQVRIASLQCLSTILQMKSVVTRMKSNFTAINIEDSHLHASIDGVFTHIRDDKKPEVIAEAGKALKFWKLLNLNK